MNGIRDIGKMALGSRLRVLSDSLMENARKVYDLYEVPLKPKWFPVFYVLSKQENLSIGSIAKEIGHSHPSVIKIVKELKAAGIAISVQDEHDARKTNVGLTDEGREIAKRIEIQYTDVNSAVEEMLASQTHDLWRALDELEFLLGEKSMFRRVVEQRKRRESNLVEIVNYTDAHKEAFKAFNLEWIEKHFKVEGADLQTLDHPEENILSKGGAILVALYGNEVAGVCALVKANNDTYDFELAKMAVSGDFRGKGIGYALGKAIIRKAREEGAKSIYLESNTLLEPAISLYQKLGFKKVKGIASPYERSNIQMELRLRE